MLKISTIKKKGWIIAWFLSLLILTSFCGWAGADSGGIFTSGPDMVIARMNHWIVPLTGGKVILLGGHGTQFVSLNSAEIWDPGTNSFTRLDMNYTHDAGALVKLSDGRYLIAGGSADWGVAPGYNSAEIYDPSANTFTPTGTMVYPRMNCNGTLLTNGKVLIAGGWYDSNSPKYGELYDPATGTFTATQTMNTPRAVPIILPTDDGKAVVIGGIPPYGGTICEQIELYDPGTNSFSVLQENLFSGETGWLPDTVDSIHRPIEKEKLSDGKYLLAAWKSSDFVLFTFNPGTKQFAKISITPALPANVSPYHPILNKSAGKAYVFTQVLDADPIQLRLYTIDLATGTRNNPTDTYSLPPSYYLSSTAKILLQDGRIFITGGHSQTGYNTNFSPIKNTAFVQPPAPTSFSCDINGDGKAGLEEIIYLLQVVAGGRQ